MAIKERHLKEIPVLTHLFVMRREEPETVIKCSFDEKEIEILDGPGELDLISSLFRGSEVTFTAKRDFPKPVSGSEKDSWHHCKVLFFFNDHLSVYIAIQEKRSELFYEGRYYPSKRTGVLRLVIEKR